MPLLRLLAVSSPMTWNDCTIELSKHFSLEPSERCKMMPDGKCGVMKYRVGWAKANLKRIGLVNAVSRGVYTITESGLEYVKNLGCNQS